MLDLFYNNLNEEIIKNNYNYLGDKVQKYVFEFYNILNKDTQYFKNNDDICTPMECVKTMIDYIPTNFWDNQNLKILDPCCGNGNFGAYSISKTNLDNIYFNDIDIRRINQCKNLLQPKNIYTKDFLLFNEKEWDLIMANPPYSGGGNKNKSISNLFIEHSIDILKDKGYLCFITPNNWMTYNNNNTTLKKLLNNGSFLVIDNDAKKFFPKVGSSFTIFVWQKNIFNNITLVKNNFLKKDIQKVSIPNNLKFLPLYISQTIIDIIKKSIQEERNNFNYRCDLHNYTKKSSLSDYQDNNFQYETIHTPSKTRYATIKQDIYDKWSIIIPLSTYYKPYIKKNVNVTQSVGYFSFSTEEEAKNYLTIINKDWIKILVHITRYGNFNNILLLKHLKIDSIIEFSIKEINLIEDLIKYIKY